MNFPQETLKKVNTHEINCILCNYKTTSNVDWLKHIETQKHKRNGMKKSTKCDQCNYESTSHWNIKLHKLYVHATIEEKKKHKYYCEICDVLFLCPAYQKKHNEGKLHNNRILIKKSLEDIDMKFKEINDKKHNINI